jgi:hypothetical protein
MYNLNFMVVEVRGIIGGCAKGYVYGRRTVRARRLATLFAPEDRAGLSRSWLCSSCGVFADVTVCNRCIGICEGFRRACGGLKAGLWT